MKICSKCRTEKELKDFSKDKKNKDGLDCRCKNCIKEYKKKYYEENKRVVRKYQNENKENIKQKRKEYIKENREKLNQQKREYWKNNRDTCNRRQREYHKEKIKNDPIFRLKRNLRSLAHRAMIRGHKSASTQELLGCTWEEARIHIENQFTEGMCWENYPEWEIDHIKPIASFSDLTDPEQQRQCCHYTNYQPMWAKENRSKSSLWNGIKHYHTKTN